MVNLFFSGMLTFRPMTIAVTNIFSFKIASNMGEHCSSKALVWHAMKFVFRCLIPRYMLSSTTIRYMYADPFLFFLYVKANDVESLLF